MLGLAFALSKLTLLEGSKEKVAFQTWVLKLVAIMTIENSVLHILQLILLFLLTSMIPVASSHV